MPVTKKSILEDKKREADKASDEQMQDLYAAISGLGSATTSPAVSETKNSNSIEINTSSAQENSSSDFKTVTADTTAESDQKNDKPGYVSLVIPNSLKKKWKLYSTVHGMSLTDCLKLGMKLLEEMEQKGTIKIEGGFLTING